MSADRDPRAASRAGQGPRGYDWVIVTSPNGARARIARVASCPRSRRSGPERRRLSVRSESNRPSCHASRHRTGLLAEFPRPRGARALRGHESSPEADRGARRRFRGALHDETRHSDRPAGGRLVVLASGSAARSFADLGVEDHAVTIGPPDDPGSSIGGTARARGGGDARSRGPHRRGDRLASP